MHKDFFESFKIILPVQCSAKMYGNIQNVCDEIGNTAYLFPNPKYFNGHTTRQHSLFHENAFNIGFLGMARTLVRTKLQTIVIFKINKILFDNFKSICFYT